MKHRLFWKFLLAFWAALVLVALLAILGGRLLEKHYRDDVVPDTLESGPRAALLLDAAQVVLWSSGSDAMRELMRAEAIRQHDLFFAVDEQGNEILGRPLPTASLAEAHHLTAGQPPEAPPPSAVGPDGQMKPTPIRGARRGPRGFGGKENAVRKLQDAEGHVWLLFVAEDNSPHEIKKKKRRADRTGEAAGMAADAGPASRPEAPRGPLPDASRNPSPDESRDPPPDESREPPPDESRDPSPDDSRDLPPGASGDPPPDEAGEPPPDGPPPRFDHDRGEKRYPPPQPRDRAEPGKTGWGWQWPFEMDSRSAQALVIGAAVLCSFLFAAWLAWSLTRPVRTLRQALDAAARGKLDTRVAGKMGRGRNEITALGRHFDHMIEQIQRLLTSQRRLLHDVSHELRSPLARLQAASDLARQNPARLQDSLDRIDRETARLDQLIDQALTLSRLEAGTSDEEPVAFDLGRMMQDIVADADFEAQTRHVQVKLHCEAEAGALEVFLREELIHRACENIIRNAIKFTAEHTVVDVLLSAPSPLSASPASGGQDGAAAEPEGDSPADPSSDGICLQVMDRGPGVPAGQIDRIFTPFFRAQSAQGFDGYGLGLAIVQQAVMLHRGRIRARAREDGGLIVAIWLPRRVPGDTKPAGRGASSSG